MSSWRDRVHTEIVLASPSGLVFTPGWKGDEMSFEKHVGQFNYPKINGTLTQDLGRGGFLYPLTLYFEGADNDIESLRFMKAAGDEAGPWTVIHPVDGQLTLQLINSPKRPIQPITSGNLTIVTTEWIVPIEAEGNTTTSSTELATAIDSSIAAVDSATEASAVALTSTSTTSQLVATATAVKRNLASLKKAIVSQVSRVNAIIKTINALITSATVDMEQISGAVITLMESPSLFTGSVVSKIKNLESVGAQFIKNLPGAETYTTQDRNAAIVGEVFLTATVTAMATTAISETPDTRAQALAMLSTFIDFMDDVLAAIDAMNSKTAASDLDDQYFGGISTAQSMANLRGLVERYLLSIMSDLQKERRFMLDRDRHPLEIAITEYQASADTADDYYELFCSSNNLHGRDRLLLTAGREVVVYE